MPEVQTDSCYEVEPAVDVVCVEYGTSLIEQIIYTASNEPLTIPPAVAGQTAEQTLVDYLTSRMILPNTDRKKLHIHKCSKAQMPFASVQYKTDPHTGVKIPSEQDTDMKFEGKDYRNNDPLYDFYSRIGDGRQYLAWAKQGSHLIGGVRGLLGSFVATAGVIDGAEMANQINWEFGWKGKPVPDRLRLP